MSAIIAKGLEGIVANTTNLSDVLGNEGILIYAGYNINEIAGKATVISEINDLTISTQVKALVLKNLGRNVYQRTLITTENSIVYVMGFVTKTEAAALENVVSSVRGVKRIVRVFEYID